MARLFPTFLIIIDLCAAIVYAVNGDVKRAIYWVAAGTLTACVTY